MNFRPISIGLLPNFTWSDIPSLFKIESIEKLEEKMREYFGIAHAIYTDSGRVAQWLILKCLGVGKGDEVIIQAFTCVAVPNAIISLGAVPIYVDIDKTYNLDLVDLAKKVTSRTKVVIVQHTFGSTADIEKIARFCQKRKIVLIEDLAHGLGGEINGKKLGTFGRAAFLSFGKDKVISGLGGGAVITNDNELNKQIIQIGNSFVRKSIFSVLEQFIYTLLIFKIRETYTLFNVGKINHKFMKSLGFEKKAVERGEKEGIMPKNFFVRPSSIGVAAILKQLNKIDQILKHRESIANVYAKELEVDLPNDSTYLRFQYSVSNPVGLRQFAARQNIFLGDWYDSVVAPKGVNLDAICYKSDCPLAEKATREVVNLPTGPTITLEDAVKVVETIKLWKSK